MSYDPSLPSYGGWKRCYGEAPTLLWFDKAEAWQKKTGLWGMETPVIAHRQCVMDRREPRYEAPKASYGATVTVLSRVSGVLCRAETLYAQVVSGRRRG
jgi:hypothetical protein